jgi:sensor histidine kinase regulating citrate/malate metabolism
VRGNNIETTKEDKTSHGYGLYSLNKIIKNLDGSLNLSCADRIFKVEIDISIEQLVIYA